MHSSAGATGLARGRRAFRHSGPLFPTGTGGKLDPASATVMNLPLRSAEEAARQGAGGARVSCARGERVGECRSGSWGGVLSGGDDVRCVSSAAECPSARL